MDPRMRAGLVAGGGAAIATFLTSFVCFCLSGPFIAAVAGANAGFAVVRNNQYARDPGNAGAVAGLYGGAVVAIAQLFGMTLAVALERDQLNDQLASQFGPYGVHYTPATLWGTTIFASILTALVDVGIMAGAGAVAAINSAKRMPGNTAQGYAPRGPVPPYPPAYPPAPLPSQMPPAPSITTAPPSYPPPPSYYGLSDATPEAPSDAPPDTPEV